MRGGLGWAQPEPSTIIIITSKRYLAKPNEVILYGARARRGSCVRGGVSGCCVCGTQTERAGRDGMRTALWA